MKNTGEIKLNSPMGTFLYTIAKDTKYKYYIETGTKYADGSTYCLLQGLLTRNDDSILYGYETNQEFFNKAISNLKNISQSRVYIQNKSLVTYAELPDIPTFNNVKKKDYLYNIDLDIAGPISEKLKHIDVLLLDSGGWSRQAEWDKYKEDIKVIILDDTLGSTKLIREEILNNKNKWTIIHDDLNTRAGWLAARLA